MIQAILRGGISGGLGTLALNVTTYLDMAVRGRSPSEVPEQVVGRQAAQAGLSLGREPAASNRRMGIGALLGYGTGIGLGAAYGLIRTRTSRSSVPGAGAALGALAMLAPEGAAASMGVTDPRRWGISGWLTGIVPHAVFGLVTAMTFDHLESMFVNQAHQPRKPRAVLASSAAIER